MKKGSLHSSKDEGMVRIQQTDDVLPKYRCHKIVSAAKITGIESDPNFEGHSLLVFGEIQKFIQVEPTWLKRNGPIAIGGYYVVYEDGYRSYSPGLQFDAGYTILDLDSLLNSGNNSVNSGITERKRNKKLFKEVLSILKTVGPDIEANTSSTVVAFSPKLLADTRNTLVGMGNTLTHIVFGGSAWGSLVGNQEFANLFDPVTKYEDVLAGKVGHLLGVPVITDAFFSPNLDDNERHVPNDTLALVSYLDGELKAFASVRI